MTFSITVRHNFETAHRLPPLGGKCEALHGHSWWTDITLSTEHLDGPGIVAEYGAVKDVIRGWIDEHLDHGAMLGVDDPLREYIAVHGKVYVFGRDKYTTGLMWPTVEAVAAMLGEMAEDLTAGDLPGGELVYVSRVRVTETAVNAAEWTP